MKKLSVSKTVFGLVLVMLVAGGSASGEPWRFGVMSIAGWTTTDACATKTFLL